jgi:integrase
MKIRRYESKGLEYWRADLGVVDGKRVQKQFPTKAAAEAFLVAKRKEKAQGGVEALALSNGERAEFTAARARLAGLGWTITQAVEFIMRYGKVTTDKSLAEAVAECVTAKSAAGKRARYVQQLDGLLSRFARHFEGRKCSEVSHSDIESWLSSRGWAAATRKSTLCGLQTFFSFAVKRGFVNFNPCERLESIALEDKAPGILTVEDCEKLLASAMANDAALVPYLAIGLFCGLRPAEVERLSWSEVDIERGLVEVTSAKSKTRQRRFVTISENCKAWLRLGGDLGAKLGCQSAVNKRRLAVIKAAGITWKHDAMRHSFASYHLAKHGSADKTAHEMGHGSTQMLFAHYRELVRPDGAEKFWNILPAAPVPFPAGAPAESVEEAA